MKHIHLILFFFLIPLPAFLQSTIISGTANGAAGQEIRLIAAEDFISGKTVVLCRSKIAPDGSFQMECDLKETRRLFLDINYQRTEIFMEPGEKYQLALDYQPEEQEKSYFDREPIPYEIIDPGKHELNSLLWEFNVMYNRFIKENFNRIYIIRDKQLVKDFKHKVDSTFQTFNNDYLAAYIRYKFADIEQFARIKSKDSIAKEYFQDNPILYHNVEYTYFFNEFFGQLLLTSPKLITISDLIIAVNETADLAALDQALLRTAYLDDERLRELVLIHNMIEIYANKAFFESKVLALLRRMQARTPYPGHRAIISNILYTFKRLSPGSPAPNLKLTSIGGFEFDLNKISSRPKLLMFFNSGQAITKAYFDELAIIYDKYSAGLELICISMDLDPAAYLPLANSGNYNWTFAHYGNKPEVYDKYDIRDLPLFVLIDVEGNIARYPAPHPGTRLEGEIMRVIH